MGISSSYPHRAILGDPRATGIEENCVLLQSVSVERWIWLDPIFPALHQDRQDDRPGILGQHPRGDAQGLWHDQRREDEGVGAGAEVCSCVVVALNGVNTFCNSPFWYGTASGVYNYEKDIYEMVKTGQVRVHREDISQLSKGTINFVSGKSIQADALITATGFSAKPTLHFSPSTIHSELGIPSTSLTKPQHEFWRDMNQKADLTIAASFPRLLAGPFTSPKSTVVQPFNPGVDPELNYTPFRLYRAIAPPGLTKEGDHSLAFISMFSNLANTPRCELQCLWAYAYLNDKLDINASTVFEETALMAQWAKYRAPYGHGRFFPDLVFDQVPYCGMLLQDLKLRYWRKPNMLAEVFGSYRGADYNGVVQEWLKANSKGPTNARDVERAPLLGDTA